MEKKDTTKNKTLKNVPAKTKRQSKVENIKKALQHYETHERPFNPELFSGLLEEYLDSFIVVGYTQKGDPVQLTSAKSQQEIDALSTNLQRFISMFIMGPGRPPMESEMRDEDD
jgi:hypothetical protein